MPGLLDMPGLVDIRAPRPLMMNLPTAPAAPQPGPIRPPGLLERLMPTPAGMQGLLSEEALRQARAQGLLGFGSALLDAAGPVVGGPAPSLGQALARGLQAGMGAYQNAAQQAAQGELAARQMPLVEQQMRVQGAQLSDTERILLARQQIREQFAPRGPETREQALERLKAMFTAYVQAGDTEMVGRLAQVIAAMQGEQREPGTWMTVMGPDGKPRRRYVTASEAGETGIEEYINRDSNPALELQRSFGRENRLQAQYEKAVKPWMDARNNIEVALTSVPEAVRGEGLAQVALLYAFIDALDPESVVREGEVALARAATPLWTRAKAWVSQVENKSMILPPETVQQLAELLRRRQAGYEGRIKKLREHYIGIAGRYNIPDAETLFLENLGSPGVIPPSTVPGQGFAPTSDGSMTEKFLGGSR